MGFESRLVSYVPWEITTKRFAGPQGHAPVYVKDPLELLESLGQNVPHTHH